MKLEHCSNDYSIDSVHLIKTSNLGQAHTTANVMIVILGNLRRSIRVISRPEFDRHLRITLILPYPTLQS